MRVLVLVSLTDADVPIIDSCNCGRPRYIPKPQHSSGGQVPSTVKIKVHRTVKIRMEAAAPKGKKEKYEPKARILVDRDGEEYAVESCMGCLGARISFENEYTKWTADDEPTMWSWVD